METIQIQYLDDTIEKLAYIDGKSDWIDLRSAVDVELKAGEFKLIHLGIAMKLPEGYEAHVVPRSSTYKNFGIIQTNHCGIIDSSYCGPNDYWYMPAYALRDTVIHKNAMELTRNGLGKERRAHRRVHAARKPQQHMVRADLPAHLPDQLLFQILEVIVPGRAADLVKKMPDHGRALRGALHLRMKLHTVQPALRASNGRIGTRIGMCHRSKARRQSGDLVGMAHEADLIFAKPPEKHRGGVHRHAGLAVFAGLAGGHFTAGRPRKELCAIANAQHRDAHIENGRIAMGRFGQIDAVRAAGQNNADGIDLPDRLRGDVPRFHDRVDMTFPHTPGDQFLILPAKIENQNRL